MGKLKPLGIKTVGDLLDRTPAQLAAAGLLERELVEIAEAAADLELAWSSESEARAAANSVE